ncbi:hypothetical protein [Moheibacter sediminis]|uniref:Uncharacterized protein n=1 Tax=Moheibacter sediminis TaxID=1434700 RepID=A0A1W1Z799_9FLAO|nr:hypothetical protein [Moheibacter sediminis]SMC43798.1 hypothetical protein SAMN06296427_102225 [Moheibacter sediminis]
MATITVKLANENDLELLKKILETTDFEEEIETFEEDVEELLSDQEILMLNERLVEYKQNPDLGLSVEETKLLLKSKYGI